MTQANRVQELLENLLREVRTEREAPTLEGIQPIARALVEDPDLFAAAPNLLEHDNWKVRYLTLRAMEVCGHPGLPTALVSLAQDDSPEIRATVERLSVGGPGQEELSLEELLPLLRHQSWWVRKKAVIGLGRCPAETSHQALKELVGQEQDAEVRELAAGVLEQWRQQGVG